MLCDYFLYHFTSLSMLFIVDVFLLFSFLFVSYILTCFFFFFLSLSVDAFNGSFFSLLSLVYTCHMPEEKDKAKPV